MRKIELEPGSLLIAPPSMPDPRFQDRVLLLVQHETTGSVAFTLNKPTDYVINDILDEIGVDGNLPFPLYWGGPVKSSAVWMLHDSDWTLERSVEVNQDWSMTSSHEMFHHLCDGDTPQYFRFLHGISTWGPGQLEGEIRGEHPWSPSSSWLIAPNPGSDWVLECPEEHLWEQAMEVAKDQFVADLF